MNPQFLEERQRMKSLKLERRLRELLSEGPRSIPAVKSVLRGEGYPIRAISEAAKVLGVRRVASGRKGQPWTWELPGGGPTLKSDGTNIRLAEKRERLEVLACVLAYLADIHPQALLEWERGTRLLAPYAVLRIDAALSHFEAMKDPGERRAKIDRCARKIAAMSDPSSPRAREETGDPYAASIYSATANGNNGV